MITQPANSRQDPSSRYRLPRLGRDIVFELFDDELLFVDDCLY